MKHFLALHLLDNPPWRRRRLRENADVLFKPSPVGSESYHQRIELDDVLCDVNIYFENGRITKVSIVNATSGDVTLNSTYTYTYN